VMLGHSGNYMQAERILFTWTTREASSGLLSASNSLFRRPLG
jgi:hypothetical protein